MIRRGAQAMYERGAAAIPLGGDVGESCVRRPDRAASMQPLERDAPPQVRSRGRGISDLTEKGLRFKTFPQAL